MAKNAVFVIFVVLGSYLALSEGARVTFCSGPNLTGTCATKNVEVGMFRNKCEDFPFRFRWFFTARSVRVEPTFFGGACTSVCRLHQSDSCRCWFGNCPTGDFTCAPVNLGDNHGFKGVTCT